MTPEAILTELRARLGAEVGEAAWMVLLDLLEGRRLYWPMAVRRRLLARQVYEARGEHPLSLARKLGVSRRTVERMLAAEKRRRGRMRRALPKTDNPNP